MKPKYIFTMAAVLLAIHPVFAENSSLPSPPHEFFIELGRTEIPPGKPSCCEKLRAMLTKSVMISPYLAIKLFREGKLVIGDSRSWDTYQGGHILGAIPLPYDKVDFMKLKPVNIPIALY